MSFVNTIEQLGDGAVLASIIDGTITEFMDDTITTVADYAFYGRKNLTKLVLPNVTRIGNRSFCQCSNLETVDLTNITYLSTRAFENCTGLKKIIIRSNKVPDDQDSSVFAGVYLYASNLKCHFYVPRDLIETYKATEYFWMYPDAYRALEDYTVDGTITGELDESKI